MHNREPLVELREAVGAVGLALLAAGLTLLHSAALAMVVCGALLFGLAVCPLILPPRSE